MIGPKPYQEVINQTLQLINSSNKESLSLFEIPLNDQKTLSLYKESNIEDIYYTEPQDKKYYVQIDNLTFDDLVLVSALRYPGQEDRLNTFLSNRKDYNIFRCEYDHEIVTTILKETYGIVVFQDQLIDILKRSKGLSYNEAYYIYKMIFYASHEVLDFGNGRRKMDEKEAVGSGEIIDFVTYIIKRGYSMNRNYLLKQALLSYQTAFLKAHYPKVYKDCIRKVLKEHPV